MTIKGWENYSIVEAEETPVSHLVIESSQRLTVHMIES